MAEYFKLHDASDAECEDSSSSSSEDEGGEKDNSAEIEKLLSQQIKSTSFRPVAEDEDPWHPGEKMPPGMKSFCVMLKQYEQDPKIIAKLTGILKQFATTGKSIVEAIDTLEQELRGTKPLASLYDHVEIVLHDKTRWRICKGNGPDGKVVQFIKLSKKGLPIEARYRQDGYVEPYVRYIAFFVFKIPAANHLAVEQWCTKLAQRKDSYDLTSTTLNSYLRLVDLRIEKALSGVLKGSCCSCSDDDDDEDEEEEVDECSCEETPRKKQKGKSFFKTPVTLFQNLAPKPKWNCVTLSIKTLKKAGLLDEQDVTKRAARCFTAMDLMRLLLSKSKVGSSPRKWGEGYSFVISKELHVLWRGLAPGSAEYRKAEEEYDKALLAQHQIGLAGTDEAMKEHLEKVKSRQKMVPRAAMVGAGARRPVVARELEDEIESGDDDPLLG